jgi:hypothetical protein
MSRLAKTRSTTGLATAFVLFVAGVAFTASRNAAGDVYADQEEQSKVEIGLRIAPVPLNMSRKSRELVGLGSYIVNALADCNGCHTASSQETYVFGGVPYFGQKPTIVNPAVYLGGGQDFGTLDPLGQTAHIVSRNLTPDKTGRPEGGHTFEEFRTIMRTGADLDHIHPTCASGATDRSHCVPPPFDGGLLQVMPWPAFQNMTDRELRAIYEYLSAVPCVAGPQTGILHNDCS